MEILLGQLENSQADVVVVAVKSEFKGDNGNPIFTQLSELKNQGKFKGEKGELYLSYLSLEGNIKQVLYLGLGSEITSEVIRSSFSKGLKKVKELKATEVVIELGHLENQLEVTGPLLESLYLTNYKFNKYKSESKNDNQLTISLNGVNFENAQNIITEAKALAQFTSVARDLVNEPANVIYPETLANEAVSLGEKCGFDVEVIDESGIIELGMKAFYEVAKGSEKPPRLIVMRYKGNPEKPEEILGYVGKGLTYDSGGYALKPADGMVTMKCDMGGSAAVIGAMAAIASQKLRVNVTAVVAACENMISGGAYKNGDIIGSMAGKTIEIINTDAEGRLTLADAVYYTIEKEKVTKIVDVATLTGAALVALGTSTTAVLANDDEFYASLEVASKISGEKVWRLPIFDDYKQLIKSDVADIKNSGGRFAGTITGGLFVGEFVGKTPWLHLDIAGTAWAGADADYITKGGTGVAVRTLYHLAKGFQ